MSDRPTGANGKRNKSWGTTMVCPDCGHCLCFACHPEGPCQDDHGARAVTAQSFASLASGAPSSGFAGGWTFEAARPTGVAGLRLES